ncbi:hypothetical protein [Mycolicibacterium frederiksbergense]|uniref:hypothetical protein n=1 Tax=Mycolicibacterium frederiksbergense TaxID=117567 RepID=UPI00399BC487
MKVINERDIAWELADYLKPYLCVDERNRTFVDLGSDDFLTAIYRLLTIAKDNQFALPAVTLERLHLWARIYQRERELAPTLARIRKLPPR